ncbi:alginate lyase [Bacteroidia bacterium]|nr:alginate lyase [Bacteroidia bacterium]
MNNLKFFSIAMISLLCFAACRPVSKGVETFLVKPAVLASNKQKIESGDEKLKEALARLLAEAGKSLQNGPYSVTMKSKLPPSGDKHDYMSVGPYWWPDPAKPDGLPYIRKDGETNPERYEIQDAEFFKSLSRDVHLLAIAYFYTGREEYAEKAVSLLRAWFLDEDTRMNPNLDFGQAIPGRTDGRGIGLIDTRGVVNLIDGIRILQTSKSLDAAGYKGLQDWFTRFLDWMTTSPIGLDEADEHNNHGTYYDVQTVSIALFTGQPERAAQMLEQQTKPRIESQIAGDGSQPHELARTLSWGYSQMNLAGFFELASLAENAGMDLWNYVTPGGKSIKKAYFWMLPYANGDSAWTYQQIKPLDKSEYANLSRIAVAKYPDEKIASFLAKSNEANYLFILTH